MKILDTVYVYRLGEGEKLTWHGRYHSHKENEFEIHFFDEGEGSFLANKTRYSITKGSLFLSGPHEFHSIIPQRVTKPLTYYAVLFSLNEAEDKDLRLLLEMVIAKNHSCLNENTVERFIFNELFTMRASLKESQLRAANYLFASYIYRWYADVWDEEEVVSFTESAEKKTSKEYVKKAIDIMKKNTKQASVEDVAWKLGLSVEHFIRLFKNEMNITPHQYWMRLRVQDAATRLIGSDKTIGKIAQEFGFETQFHFSRVFKKCTGFSPTEYRGHYKMQSE